MASKDAAPVVDFQQPRAAAAHLINNRMDKPDGTTLTPIAILFEDPKINLLIAGLLNARGFQTRIIEGAADLSADEKVVTEPQYFSQLPRRLKKSCLLIGNREALDGADAITLARPLTEEKIEEAIGEFLKP